MSKSAKTVTIHIVERDLSELKRITVPDFVYDQVSHLSRVQLCIGMTVETMTFETNGSDSLIELSQDLAMNFGLDDEQVINILVTEDHKIRLGPVIAVFASNGSVRKSNMQHPNFRYIELIAANTEANTILYHFSIKDVDFIQQKINGTFYNPKSDRWEQKPFPFPDVLYDRGGGTLPDQKVISEYIRSQFGRIKELKHINCRYFFDKWDVHQNLMEFDSMNSYLPRTVLYNAGYNLIEMFEQTSVVYIKDCLGNNGRGVARACKLGEGTYTLSLFQKEVREYRFKSFDGLIQKIDTLFSRKKTILQEAIDVIQINARNVDMRAAVQRDENGELVVGAYPVRLGVEDCPITSTKSGATVYRFETFFKKHYSFTQAQLKELSEEIKQFLITSFRCVEAIYGDFGELGIDFAIDKQGKLWFIECNAKPGKDALYLSYDNKTIRKAFQNPINYGKYLCGF
jgi:hypothetical protein